MRAWSQIAPLLKKLLQKERVSQILLLHLPYLSGLIHILICSTKIGKKIRHNKIPGNFLLLRHLKNIFVIVLRNLGHDVREERKKNERGAWKARMITY